MSSVLKANINYMYILAELICGKNNSILNYKLIRKEVFLSTANLSGAFNRMLSEPKSKQRKGKEIYEFVVLNNVLSSNIAGLIGSSSAYEDISNQKEALQYMRQSIHNLEESLLKLDETYLPVAGKIKLAESAGIIKNHNNQLFEQLDFVYKLTNKINKTTVAITRKS